MKKLIAKLGLIGWLGVVLTGCTDSQPATALPVRSSIANATPETTPTVRLVATPTVTPQSALLPTATPPPELPPTTVPATRFPTVSPRSTQPVLDVGPSLTAFRTTKVSFQTAYARAIAQMGAVNGQARLVLAQATSFSPDHSVWTFFFTLPGGKRSWSILYDSAGGKDKKESLSVLERASVLLPDDAGQLAPSKILDSDEITTRLVQNGLPPELPIDTVYLQIVNSTKQGRVPAYLFVNGALNKQIIVNATNGQVLQNDFI